MVDGPPFWQIQSSLQKIQKFEPDSSKPALNIRDYSDGLHDKTRTPSVDHDSHGLPYMPQGDFTK